MSGREPSSRLRLAACALLEAADEMSQLPVAPATPASHGAAEAGPEQLLADLLREQRAAVRRMFVAGQMLEAATADQVLDLAGRAVLAMFRRGLNGKHGGGFDCGRDEGTVELEVLASRRRPAAGPTEADLAAERARSRQRLATLLREMNEQVMALFEGGQEGCDGNA